MGSNDDPAIHKQIADLLQNLAFAESAYKVLMAMKPMNPEIQRQLAGYMLPRISRTDPVFLKSFTELLNGREGDYMKQFADRLGDQIQAEDSGFLATVSAMLLEDISPEEQRKPEFLARVQAQAQADLNGTDTFLQKVFRYILKKLGTETASDIQSR